MDRLEKYLYNKKLEKMLRLEESAEKMPEWDFNKIRNNGPKDGWELNTLVRINWLLKLNFLIGETVKINNVNYIVADVKNEGLGSVFLDLISDDDLCNLGGKRLSYRELDELGKQIDWEKLEDIKVEEDIRIPYQPCSL